MIFWTLVEVVIATVLILIFVTQIFIPLWNGTKWFPAIRRRELDARLKEIKEESEKEELIEEIEDELEKLKKKREEKKKDEGLGE